MGEKTKQKHRKKESPEVRAVTLQYSQHCCSSQIAFPRWLTPEQMLLVRVLAAMHQVQTLFFFHLDWFVSSQIAYPRKLISWLGEINHGVTPSRPECCLRICCLWCLQNPRCDCQDSRCVGFGVIFHCRSFSCLLGSDFSLPLSYRLSLSLSRSVSFLFSFFFLHCYTCLSIQTLECTDVRSASVWGFFFGDANKQACPTKVTAKQGLMRNRKY